MRNMCDKWTVATGAGTHPSPHASSFWELIIEAERGGRVLLPHVLWKQHDAQLGNGRRAEAESVRLSSRARHGTESPSPALTDKEL